MFSTKRLSEEQISEIRSWAAAGAQLPDIQARIRQEFEISVTFMDTRLIILDLGIELVEEEKEVPQPEIKIVPVPTGKVTVTMDSIAIPGALVSGKAEFSDGESAVWMLDQSGRPSLNPDTPGYNPGEEDIVEFQKQLRDLIQNAGL